MSIEGKNTKGVIKLGNVEIPILDFSMDVSYAPFREYGFTLVSPEPKNVVEGSAIVIDEQQKALPAPQEEKEQ